MSDVFNNPSNDYINPGLAPCSGTSDSYTFKFLPKGEVGIVSGKEIVQAMDLSDIEIAVTAWVNEQKIIRSGEVIYVPGLTKGLNSRTQYFDIPINPAQTDQEYFFILDLSINYYYNFRYYDINIEASANYTTQTNITNVLNSVFSNNHIAVTVMYDPSNFTFTGTNVGWDYDITNTVLTLIDASQNSSSPFAALIIDGERIAQTYTLVEDSSSAIPAAKYLNGGMLGYVLKGTYPSTAGDTNRWFYLNNVQSPFSTYDTISFISNITDISTFETLTLDGSITYSSLTFDPSWNRYDVSLGDVSLGNPLAAMYDSSIWNQTVDSSIITNVYVLDSSITAATITDSYVNNSLVLDSSMIRTAFLNSDVSNNISVTDSSFLDTRIADTSINQSFLQGGSFSVGVIFGSRIKNVDISMGDIINSILDGSLVTTYNYKIYDSSITDSSISKYETYDTNFYNSIIEDSSLQGGDISTGFIWNSKLTDVSIISTTTDVSVKNTDIFNGNINNIEGHTIYTEESSIGNSQFQNSVFNNTTYIVDSSIQNSYTNAYKVGSRWYISDVSHLANSSRRINIHTSYLIDMSINNAAIYDSSIYTSRIQDASLIRCTIYNADYDASTTLENCRNTTVNAAFDCSISWTEDVSTYYQKHSKKVDVGMSGTGNATTLSAADYLDYINTNNFWNKVGPFMSHISESDPSDNITKNLVTGFYIFNPHEFSIKVEYLLIN